MPLGTHCAAHLSEDFGGCADGREPNLTTRGLLPATGGGEFETLIMPFVTLDVLTTQAAFSCATGVGAFGSADITTFCLGAMRPSAGARAGANAAADAMRPRKTKREKAILR